MSACKRCDKALTGKQLSYCSQRCSKLHLKSLWRKRRHAQLAAYNRAYRSQGPRPLNKARKLRIIADRGGKCERCSTVEKLNVHHIKPVRFGGTNVFVMVLCFPCHMQWEKRMRGYWLPLVS